MVLIRGIGVVLFLISSGYSQKIFYTDNYFSNFYTEDESKFVFHNNAFQILNDSSLKEVKTLILDFFESEGLEIQEIASTNDRQLTFSYQETTFEPIVWSKAWHQNYEKGLSQILKNFLFNLFEKKPSVPSSLEEAAIVKLAYYDWQNFKMRPSEFTKTKVSISTNSLDVKSFNQAFIAPNFSFGRLLTNSFQNFYNESYPISGIDETIKFVFGPTSKSRLKDCLSMHIHGLINKKDSPIYLNYQTVLIESSDLEDFIELDLDYLVQQAKIKLVTMLNRPDESFYNSFDSSVLDETLKDYTWDDYIRFKQIYFSGNNYTYGQPMCNQDSCFDISILYNTVNFKSNVANFMHLNDSLSVQILAQFLQHNRELKLILLGSQEKDEYTKIDKKEYRILIDLYSRHFPVKSSKNPELAILRSVVVFDYLFKLGVDPKRLSCIADQRKSKDGLNTSVKWIIKQ